MDFKNKKILLKSYGISIMVTWLILFFAFCTTFAEESYHGPKCIGKFCFDGDLIKKKDLVNQYGYGYSKNGKFPFFCYQASTSTYVHFRAYHAEGQDILSIFVSDTQNCIEQQWPKASFSEFVTPEGLKLGDPYEKVINLYGKADFIGRADGTEKIGISYNEAINSKPFGDKVLLYVSQNNESLHSKIYIKNGKVSAIYISRSP